MFQAHRRSGNRVPRNKASLQVETLEDRWMPAVIGGVVYLDANADGLFNTGETGLAGSTLQLHDSSGNVLATTTSDSMGRYQFTQRDPGSIQPATLTEVATFDPAKTDQTRSATLAQFDPTLGTLTSVEIQAQGGIQSSAQMENLGDAPGAFDVQLNGQMSFALPGAASLQASPSTTLNATLGAFDGQADLQGSSAHDFGTTNLAGTFNAVTVTDPTALASYVGTGTVQVNESASATACGCGTGNLLAMVRSVASGTVKVIYHYTPSSVLGPGQYTVVQTTEPPNTVDGRDTPDNVHDIPGSEHTDTIPVTINAITDQSPNNNFGELPPVSLAGTVYYDADHSGSLTPGDQGLPNVTVQLNGTDLFGNTVSQTTQTTVSGAYTFASLLQGNYTITEVQPAGYLQGTNTVGSLGGTVSGDTFQLSAQGGQNGTGYNFGEVLPQAPPPAPAPAPQPIVAPPGVPQPIVSQPVSPGQPISLSKFDFIGSSWLDLLA